MVVLFMSTSGKRLTIKFKFWFCFRDVTRRNLFGSMPDTTARMGHADAVV